MSTDLPEVVDPWRAADTHAVFAGCLPLSSLTRLAGLLADSSGGVAFKLEFSRDDDNRPVVLGSVNAELFARCQRCMEAVAHDVEARIQLAVVTDVAGARALPEQYDPLLTDGGLIRPRDLIEDELLLALPQIPMHAPGACSVGVDEPVKRNRESPFAVLAGWKRK